VNSLVKTVI